jgi:hypothetical protein
MNSDYREPAALESYATFWDQAQRATIHLTATEDDAYTTFINLCEDEFPSDEWQLVSREKLDLG